MATMMDTEHAHIPDWGIDLEPSQRPGVPRELRPHPVGGAHWSTPERQAPPSVTVLKRADLAELTPVFSTAVPPHGVSGRIRRFAYTFPDERVWKWELLLVADRVDMVESAVGDLLRRVRGRR
jgi:hypothetical protein